jgi:predicted DNA-binding antitoxin AbrB/MazE fold protein
LLRRGGAGEAREVTTKAVVRGGSLEPLEKLALPEGAIVELAVTPTGEYELTPEGHRKGSREAVLAAIEGMPPGVTKEDTDELLRLIRPQRMPK